MPPFAVQLRRNLLGGRGGSESNRRMHWHLLVSRLAYELQNHGCPQWQSALHQIEIDLSRHQTGPVQHRFPCGGKHAVRLLQLHCALDASNAYTQGHLYLAHAVLVPPAESGPLDMAAALRSYTLLVQTMSHYGPGGDNVRVHEMEKHLGPHTFLVASMRRNRDVAEVLLNQRLLFLGFSQVTTPEANGTCVPGVLDYLTRYGRAGAVHLACAYVRLRVKSVPFHNSREDPERTQWVCSVLIPETKLGIAQLGAVLALAATVESS